MTQRCKEASGIRAECTKGRVVKTEGRRNLEQGGNV